MASLDSAKGPSATVRPFRPETILPSRSSGWPALHFPSCVSRSNQAYHWPTIFWISSWERPLSLCVPRNRSMNSFCVCVFIVAFLLLSCSFNDTTIEPATLGHLFCVVVHFPKAESVLFFEGCWLSFVQYYDK